MGDGADKKELGALALKAAQHAVKDSLSFVEAALQFGASKSTVERASKVVRNGTERLQAALGEGRISVIAAADISALPATDQDAAADGGQEAIDAALAKVRQRGKNCARKSGHSRPSDLLCFTNITVSGRTADACASGLSATLAAMENADAAGRIHELKGADWIASFQRLVLDNKEVCGDR